MNRGRSILNGQNNAQAGAVTECPSAQLTERSTRCQRGDETTLRRFTLPRFMSPTINAGTTTRLRAPRRVLAIPALLRPRVDVERFASSRRVFCIRLVEPATLREKRSRMTPVSIGRLQGFVSLDSGQNLGERREFDSSLECLFRGESPDLPWERAPKLFKRARSFLYVFHSWLCTYVERHSDFWINLTFHNRFGTFVLRSLVRLCPAPSGANSFAFRPGRN